MPFLHQFLIPSNTLCIYIFFNCITKPSVRGKLWRLFDRVLGLHSIIQNGRQGKTDSLFFSLFKLTRAKKNVNNKKKSWILYLRAFNARVSFTTYTLVLFQFYWRVCMFFFLFYLCLLSSICLSIWFWCKT